MSDATCSVETCDRPRRLRGWCKLHWQRWYRTGTTDDPPPKPAHCSIASCNEPIHLRGWCSRHYARWQYTGDPVKSDETLPCPLCDEPFTRTDGRTRYCETCRVSRRRAGAARRGREQRQTLKHRQSVVARKQQQANPCLVCGGVVAQQPGFGSIARLCSDECRAFHDNVTHKAWRDRNRPKLQDRQHRRRAWRWAVEWESFSPLEIFVRDQWICHVCCQPIDPSLNWPHRYSASLDHYIPLSKGGSHTRANAKAAHLICNIRKYDRLPVQ